MIQSMSVSLHRRTQGYGSLPWGLLLAAVLLYLAMNLDNGSRFPVREVRIEGRFRYLEPEQLQGQLITQLQDGFFGSDLQQIRQWLLANPWIRAATLRRLWPDVLQVVISEEQPLVRWGDAGFLNQSGELVQLPTELDEPSLPLLQGPAKTHLELLQHYMELNKILAEPGLYIRALSMDERGAMKVLLDNGWLVMLGRGTARQRMARFTHYAYRVLAGQEAEVWTVDMRYSNGYAVRWRDGVAPYMEVTVQQ